MTLTKEATVYSSSNSPLTLDISEFIPLTSGDISRMVWGSRSLSIEHAERIGVQQVTDLTIDKFKPEITGITVAGFISVFSIVVAFILGYPMLALVFTIPLLGVLICVGFLLYVIRVLKKITY